MEVRVVRRNPVELYHHGVKGMKWGVRRYRNADGSLTSAGRKRQAKQYTKELNALDKKQTEAMSNAIRSDRKWMKRAADVDKYMKKHSNNMSARNENTLRKKKEKMTAAKEAHEKHDKAYKQIDSESWNKVIDFANKGYTVNSKEVIRQAKIGERVAAHALMGILGTAVVTSTQSATYGKRYQATFKDGRTFNQTPWMVKGFKYKVTT